MAKTTPGKITLWALESDYDAKAIEIMAHKILDGKGATATIQARGRPERNIAKRGRKGLEQAVGNYLRENRRVIFILDRDGPMSKAERQKEPNSLINQVRQVVSQFTGKVHLVEAVNELEAWLLVDCLGIFCFFSQGHHALPKACKSDPKSEECRRTLAKNQKYASSKKSVGGYFR
uniref:Uncharacterized protein n=1 Tax=Candidatus Kentrum sp. FW TaxID=2126338 RepID=A0A450T1B3_9GAMM|nr:MAG: hypothetical protein BECKFW1821B_GA0114236_10551 [Candidatus Kentron sp. FW]